MPVLPVSECTDFIVFDDGREVDVYRLLVAVENDEDGRGGLTAGDKAEIRQILEAIVYYKGWKSGMKLPKRIQRKRVKGWRMPENAVYVGRPTRWGNPSHWEYLPIADKNPALARKVALTAFRNLLTLPIEELNCSEREIRRRFEILDNIEQLRGKDLACWCPLDQPCHADVLIEIANKDGGS